MVWTDIFMNPWLWLILAGGALLGINLLRMVGANRLPIIGRFTRRRPLIIVSAVMLLVITGTLSHLGFGTASVATSGVVVSDLQVTTDFEQNATEHSTIDDLIDFRYADADVSADTHFPIRTGAIAVTRSGDLPAESCQVRAIPPARYEDEDGVTSPGVTRNILVENAMGTYTVHVATGSASSTNATTSDPKETNTLAFAEGVAKGYVSVYAAVDEEGHDGLNQYSYKDILLDICGKPFTLRVHRMDA